MRRGRRVQRTDRVGPHVRLAALVLEPVLSVVTRPRWDGVEHVPRDGGVVLCSNHISHADPLTLAHYVWALGRTPRFLAKDSLFRVPVVRWVLRGAGQIPVHRESGQAGQALEDAVAAVRRGEAVCIYPEGTLTRDPALWPMVGKTGAARLALSTGAPVVPVAQWGPHRLLPPYRRVPRLSRRVTVHVVAGPPVPLEDLRARPLDADTVREGTDRILDAIAALLAQVRGEPVPPDRVDPRRLGLPRTGRLRRARGRAAGENGERQGRETA